MLDIDIKETMENYEIACAISQQLESKQYLNYYEDEGLYNAFINNQMVHEMVLKRANVENYVIVDRNNTIYLLSMTINSVYGWLPYEIKNKIIGKSEQQNKTILEKLITFVLLQYFYMVESKQDKFINVKTVYPIEQFIDLLDNTFEKIKQCDSDSDNILHFENVYGNVIEVANFWEKMENVVEKKQNGIPSKYDFVIKVFKNLLAGENEFNSLIFLDDCNFRPTKRALAFVSNPNAEALKEKIAYLNDLKKEERGEEKNA